MNGTSVQLVGGSSALAEEVVLVPERCSVGLVAGTWQALGTAMDAVRRADVVVLFPVRGIYDPFAGNTAGPPAWAIGDSWMAPLPKHAVVPEDELASDDDQDESPPISRGVFRIYMQQAARELLSPTVAGQVIVVFSPIRPGEHRREYDLFRWWLQLPLWVSSRMPEPHASTMG